MPASGARKLAHFGDACDEAGNQQDTTFTFLDQIFGLITNLDIIHVNESAFYYYHVDLPILAGFGFEMILMLQWDTRRFSGLDFRANYEYQ